MGPGAGPDGTLLVMSQLALGVDFGLSVTDAVKASAGEVMAHVARHRPGVATVELLRLMFLDLEAGALTSGDTAGVRTGVTGGRSRELPGQVDGRRVIHVTETEAVARGGLALGGVPRALVVSCGTGTAMVAADAPAGRFVHASGTAVGGGTLEGLAKHLLGMRDASAVAWLALQGDAAGVDTTLAEVLGGGVGNLPPSATAVNLGRLAELPDPEPADLAAGLVTLVGQTIALVALNAAKVAEMPRVVFVGRLAEFEAVSRVIRSVFDLYGVTQPLFPEGAGMATAFGAALAAAAAE